MRSLITGATGFAGTHLARLCAERGHEVIGLGRRPGEQEDVGHLTEYVPVDLRHAAHTRSLIRKIEPDQIFHLAGESSAEESWNNIRETLDLNLLATLNVLEGSRECNQVASVLIACSAQEYGRPESVPIIEEHSLRPQNPYSIAKAASDQLGQLYDGSELRVVRTRAFNHVGPGQGCGFVVSDLAQQIAKAEASDSTSAILRVGNTSSRRDFTDVRDVARAYFDLLASSETGVFNICRGHSISIAEIITVLSSQTSLTVEHETNPGLVRRGEIEDIWGSNEKLRNATGWEPRISFERTVADVLDWWREHVGAPVSSDVIAVHPDPDRN